MCVCLLLYVHACRHPQLCVNLPEVVFLIFYCSSVCLCLISELVAAVADQDNKKTISLTLQGARMLWSSIWCPHCCTPFNSSFYRRSKSTDPCGQLPPSLWGVDDGGRKKKCFSFKKKMARREWHFRLRKENGVHALVSNSGPRTPWWRLLSKVPYISLIE